MDLAPVVIAVSCDDAHSIDRRGQPVAHHVLDANYVHALGRAGAAAMVAPHFLRPATAGDPGDARCDAASHAAVVAHADMLRQRAQATLRGCAGLLLTGGDFDVPPALYQQRPHPRLGRQNSARTAWEWALLSAAEGQSMPILGICGGMQLINVYRGGTLYQDLSLRPHTQEHVQPHARSQPAHALALAAGSVLAEVLQEAPCAVNSTHHQAVDKLGAGLQCVATAADGVVEALAGHGSRGWLLGVQWHPEAMACARQQQIYVAFVAAARAFAASGRVREP